MTERDSNSEIASSFERRAFLVSAMAVASAFATSAARGQASASHEMMQGVSPIAIPVAFLVDEGATVIDFAGPWDVFSAASQGDTLLFRPFVVAPSTDPVSTISGMKITPNYGFADAPLPRVLVVPAQGRGTDPRKLEWIRATARTADVIMSVCTGSFLLARAGLLDGRPATTHHEAYDLFAKTFPTVRVQRNVPFVVTGKITTATAGLNGIDAALHVVAGLTNKQTAEAVAAYMGHGGPA